MVGFRFRAAPSLCFMGEDTSVGKGTCAVNKQPAGPEWAAAAGRIGCFAMETSGTKWALSALIVVCATMTVIYARISRPVQTDATQITVAFWGSYEEWAMWQDIAQGFEAENPDIFVKLNYIPDQYDDKIRRLLAANDAPDVMLIQDEPFPRYADYGKFADLTEWARGAGAPADWDHDFWPTAAESFIYEGRVVGMPIWGGNVLVYYNRKMFRDYGVAPPPDDWTFDEFIAKGKELTRDLNGDGRLDTFGFTLPGWVYFLPWTWGFGASYLNEERNDWVFTGPEAVAATRFYQSLRYGAHISPSIQEIPSSQEGAMFMTGRIGMFCSGSWASPGLRTAGIDFDVVHIPVGPSGKRFTRVTWDALCLFEGSEHKEEALRFMAYCIGPEAQGVVGRYVRSVPALKAAADSFMDASNGWNEEKYIEALSYARLQPISIHWLEMSQVMGPVYEQLLLDKITPEEAVAQMEQGMREQHVFPLSEDSE